MSKHEELELPTITKSVPAGVDDHYGKNGSNGDHYNHRNGGSVGSSITNDDE